MNKTLERAQPLHFVASEVGIVSDLRSTESLDQFETFEPLCLEVLREGVAHERSLEGAHSKSAVNKNFGNKKLSGLRLIVNEAPALWPPSTKLPHGVLYCVQRLILSIDSLQKYRFRCGKKKDVAWT